MSAFPNSPRLIKGGIVFVDPIPMLCKKLSPRAFTDMQVEFTK